jgi:hypothetical protein
MAFALKNDATERLVPIISLFKIEAVHERQVFVSPIHVICVFIRFDPIKPLFARDVEPTRLSRAPKNPSQASRFML